MNLENIKSTTTWAEASGTMNNNNAKITEAIERLESAVEEGGGGGTADSVAWNKVTGKPSWITDSKPVYAKEDLSQGVQTSLDKADTALQAIPDGYATEEYTREQVRHILNLMSTALEGKVDKVDGKQLSTEDFTTELKEKLEALSSSGGDVDSEALQELSDRLDLIVSGGASGVIDSFIDVISFLTGINDSVKLKDMLDMLRESILRKQNTIEDLDAIRSGASLGATAVQRDALSGYLPLTGGNIEGDVRIMNQSGALILVNTANGERAAFSYRGESGWYVSDNNWASDYKLWHEGNFDPSAFAKLVGGVQITAYSDLDNYTNIGTYHCNADNFAQSLSNCPISTAFTMFVYAPTGDATYFLAQKLEAWGSSIQYKRIKNQLNGTWTNWEVFTPDFTIYKAPSAVSADRAAYADSTPYAEFATYSGGINANQPMLALPTEANGIFVVDNEDGAITTNSVSVSSSIKKAIQFNWYNEPWEIGNIRGTGAYSEGFGITSGKDNLCLLVTKNGCFANGSKVLVEGDSITHAANADNATTAQLSDKSILLQGVESDDFSGTDLELNMKLFSGVSAGAEGLFPYGSNANAVLTVNKHRGNYNSQLGFSSNGLLYYRNGSNEVLTTQPWKRIMFEGDNINILRGVDGKILINSGNGFASIGDGYFNDGDILYINGKSIAMRSSDTTDLSINPSGDVDVTKNMKVAKNLTVNGAIVTTSDVGTTIVYPWGVDIKAELPSVNFFFGKGESITTRLIEHYAGSLFCEGTFIATKGLQSATSITSGGDITSGGHITSSGHVYIPNNHGVVLFDTNGIPHRSLMMSTFNDLVIGHDTASATFSTFIDGNAIYFRYSNGHYTGMTLNASGNVGIGTTEPTYKLEVVSGHYSVAMLESLQYPESSIVYKGNDKKSWAVGKGTGVTGDSFGFWSETKGGNVMLMRADGCVGIGTNDPAYKLEVVSGAGNVAMIESTSTSLEASILYKGNDKKSWAVGKGTGVTGDSFGFWSETKGGNVMLMRADGCVGIGTNDPRHELDILHNGEGLRLLSRNDKSVMLIQNVGGMNWEVGAMNNNLFAIRSTVWGGNVIVCNHSGDVGIGTSTLSARLNVGGSANVTENIRVGGNATISGTSTLRDARITEAVAIRMGVGTTISEDYALSVGGDVSVSGYVMTEGVSMYSQRSLKDVVDEEGLSLEELATIKPTRFTWKDGRDEKVHIGGIADDVQKVLPEAVRETPEGILTMDYPVASFAVASSLVKPVTDHEERIAELERENKRLREELEMIKRYIGYGNDK